MATVTTGRWLTNAAAAAVATVAVAASDDWCGDKSGLEYEFL
jgi:hypothetical protein